MSERERLERLTESLLEIERGHPGIPAVRRARLTARLADSIASVEGPAVRRVERHPERSRDEGGASPSRRPWIPLTAFLRAAAAGVTLSAPWALATGLGVASIAGVGAWGIYGATQRAGSRRSMLPPAPIPRAVSRNPAPIFPSLPPLPEIQTVESPLLPATAPREARRPSPPPAPMTDSQQLPPPTRPDARPIQSREAAPPAALALPRADSPEAALLESARAALNGGNALGALAYLDEHRLRFPGSQLLEEREILTMEAELASGRNGSAREAARVFLERHPDSLLVPRAESILGPKGTAVNPRALPANQGGAP
jgi:hypothetical protein